MRLTPRRPAGVLGLWRGSSGASRAASRGNVPTANVRNPPQRPVLRLLMRAALSLEPPAHPDGSCVLAASPANRIMPCALLPGATRLPPHPASPAPTTRHDLASVQRTSTESHGVRVRGTRFLIHRRHSRASGTRWDVAAPVEVEKSHWVPAVAGMTAVGGGTMPGVHPLRAALGGEAAKLRLPPPSRGRWAQMAPPP